MACQGSSRQKLHDRYSVRFQHSRSLRKDLSNRLSNLSEAVKEDFEAGMNHHEGNCIVPAGHAEMQSMQRNYSLQREMSFESLENLHGDWTFLKVRPVPNYFQSCNWWHFLALLQAIRPTEALHWSHFCFFVHNTQKLLLQKDIWPCSANCFNLSWSFGDQRLEDLPRAECHGL